MGKTTDELIALAARGLARRRTRASSTCSSRPASASRARSSRWRSTTSARRPSRYTGSQAGILTDAAHTKAKIREIRGDRIRASLEQGKIVLVAGFQGFSRDTMEITTLGRGGTDATAVALAAALGAACEIYSDVPGVFTADPRIVPNARKLPVVSYEEMLEMSASGAKVLMLRSVELARNHGVRIHARSTFSDEEGTWVTRTRREWSSRSSRPSPTRETDVVFTLTGIPDRPGVAAMIFDVVAGGAGERRHDHPERRPRAARRCRSRCRPRTCRRRTARSPATQDELGAFTVEENERARQGVADRRRHALASGRRGDDVPHARRPRDQPAR